MSNKMNSLALPEVAVIRKGDAKIKKVKDGREYEAVGVDLKDRFRVVFASGTAEYQKIFEAKYHTLKPERIRAMVLSRSVWESWSWANEAYNAGRMIAKADDEHYITKRNPLTGEYEVKDGEPFTKFEPGQSIIYSKHEGKKIELKIRTVGRLRLFLPEMERLVQFTLKTTSYYDRMNIDRQLNSIQVMADTLNGGNAAGVPLHVFRIPQQVVWNKSDGSAQRVEKWLVNIEADSEWVRAATARLSKFAMTGETIIGMLEPPKEVAGPVEPEPEEIDENPSDAEIIEGEIVEVEDTPQAPAAHKVLTEKTEKYGAIRKFNDAKIVAIFAKEWGCSATEAVQTLYAQRKGGKLPEMMTENEALDLAQGINQMLPGMEK